MCHSSVLGLCGMKTLTNTLLRDIQSTFTHKYARTDGWTEHCYSMGQHLCHCCGNCCGQTYSISFHEPLINKMSINSEMQIACQSDCCEHSVSDWNIWGVSNGQQEKLEFGSSFLKADPTHIHCLLDLLLWLKIFHVGKQCTTLQTEFFTQHFTQYFLQYQLWIFRAWHKFSVESLT